ncbi:ABC transporter ATP-binding protein [Inquilinus limosus]|uniref:ABC transporter ATP-binding protein n=1 Tax=Inquilinus limosus TaxID=171674 RepID=UPI0004281263|nr:ABC transporter ATP-binding protein [Inquilinus limosus]
MAAVEIEGVVRRFGHRTAVDGVELQVAQGEFLALLGPSGCGKTTLLRLLAGFDAPDAGTIRIGGRAVAGAGAMVPAEERGIGMVFQSYALWPHMTVRENVDYALRIRRLPAAERNRRAEQALAAVGLSDRAEARPDALSGGQRQRVALARCLAMAPSLVLMDEPLANLDVHLRDALQAEFRRLHRQLGATVVYVTHDQAEAMALADRIAVMDRGRLQQVAPPRRLYAEPATAMVADFVGRGMVVPVTWRGGAGPGLCAAELWGHAVRLRSGPGPRTPSQSACLRAEGLAVDPADGIPARLERAVFEGAVTILHCRPEADPARVLRVAHRGPPPEEGAALRLRVEDGWLMPAEAGAGAMAAE